MDHCGSVCRSQPCQHAHSRKHHRTMLQSRQSADGSSVRAVLFGSVCSMVKRIRSLVRPHFQHSGCDRDRLCKRSRASSGNQFRLDDALFIVDRYTHRCNRQCRMATEKSNGLRGSNTHYCTAIHKDLRSAGHEHASNFTDIIDCHHFLLRHRSSPSLGWPDSPRSR